MTSKALMRNAIYVMMAVILNIITPIFTNSAHIQAQSKSFNLNFDVNELLNMSAQEKKEFLKELKEIQKEMKEAGMDAPQFFTKIEKLLKQNKISEKEVQELVAEMSTTLLPMLSNTMESLFSSLFNESGVTTQGNIDLEELFKGLLNPEANEQKKKGLSLNNLFGFNSAPKQEVNIPLCTLNEDQLVVAPIDFKRYFSVSFVKDVKLTKQGTEVTVVLPVSRFVDYKAFTSTTYLVDIDNNERRYAPIGLSRNIPLDSILVIKNHSHSMAEFTILYPPIENYKKVKQLMLVERPNPEINVPKDANLTYNRFMIDVKTATPSKKKVVIRNVGDNHLMLHNGKGYLLSAETYTDIKTFRHHGKTYYRGLTTTNSTFTFDLDGKPVFKLPTK
ncbi:MAG: hypothetical protein ACRDDZ_05385 [Marinifilaceae bacterium]